MHVRQLVDVAGVIAAHGLQLMAGTFCPAPAHLEQYWATSKCRFESWNRALKRSAQRGFGRSDDADRWVELRATLDEIFISELLTRVWTAVLVGRDRRLKISTSEPLARSVFDSHLEARNRALALLVHSEGFSTEQAVAVNRIRRRAERWIDMLVGGLLHEFDAREFAIEPDRAFDFAGDLLRKRNSPGGRQAWRLTLVSLSAAFQVGVCPIAANPDGNARIAASVLGCFPGELFDSTGVFRSLWLTRLAANASDAQGLITDLLAQERRLGLVSEPQSLGRRRI